MERNLVKRGLTRIIFLPIVLSVLYACMLVWQLERMLDADSWVQHSTHILSVIGELQRHVQFQEFSLHGYDIVPDPSFARQFRDEEPQVDSIFELLHSETIDNVTQTRRLDTLMPLYWTWESSARHAMAMAETANHDQGPVRDTEIVFRYGIASQMHDGFTRLADEEQRLYQIRTSRFQKGSALLIFFIAAASVLLGVLVGLYARRQSRRFVDRFSRMIEETTQSRDLLSTTLLSIDDAVIVTAPDGTITMMNARALDLTGWSWPEAKDRNVETVFQGVDDKERFPIANPAIAVAHSKQTIRVKDGLTLFSRSGVEYPIEQTAAAVCNAAQEVVAVVIVFRDVTELREREREADEREREFRALIENAPDVIIRYARDLTVTYANPAVERTLGVTPEVIIGRHFQDIGIPKETYKPWEDSVEEVFRMGRGNSAEVQYRTTRGLRTYHTRLVPELADGQTAADIQSVISISRDITEMKQSEERLRESEQRFRGIVENTPDAFFLLRAVRETRGDPHSKIVEFIFEFINEQGANLLTMPAAELIGRKLTDVMPGDRPRQFIERYVRILKLGKASSEDYHIETNFVRSARWLHSQYIPIGDLLAVMTSDITERMQTTLALERSEERYRRLVEHASEAIFSTDNDGRFTYANPYVRELGGFGDEDISHYLFTDLVAPEHRQRVKRHFFRQYLSRVVSSNIEAPFIGHAGKEIWLDITATLDIEGDTVRGFDCIAIDMTDRHVT